MLADYLSFVVGLAFMLAGSWLLPPLVDWLGDQWRLPQGLLGLVVALAADSPEITSAITALAGGNHDTGVGVIFGSNVFNLAVLLGLSALVAGEVRISRRLLVLHGTVALVVTLVAAALVTAVLAPFSAFMILAAIFVSYIVVLAMPPRHVQHLPLPQAAADTLAVYVSGAQNEEQANAERRRAEEKPPPRISAWAPGTLVTAALAAVIGGSVAMVHSLLRIVAGSGIPSLVTGGVIIAALTGIPNVYTAVRLAERGRGRAVVSETLNSNTINIFVGIGIPALAVGLTHVSQKSQLEMWWLVAMIVLAVGLGAHRGRFTRANAAALVGVYCGFVTFLVL